MTADSPALITEVTSSTATIRFNRPAERNPLSTPTLHELRDTLAKIIPRPDIKAIVFTGTDDVFAAGADIRELTQLDSESAKQFSQLGQGLCQMIADAPQLTVASINGYCIGGALDLVLACDIRIASATAVFAHPGARLGIITGWGGTQRLPRIIGRAHAIEFFATARNCTAARALELGLVSEIADPVLNRALELAAIHS
ncbi:MAG: enoyl-CoA hydratase/isomerase family protein [Pyrinomonadaceae bacterium]